MLFPVPPLPIRGGTSASYSEVFEIDKCCGGVVTSECMGDGVTLWRYKHRSNET